ncbi:MAG: F0F1 ATP synthase subunit B [Bdellovibrionales bacterium]
MEHHGLLENTTFWYTVAFVLFFVLAGKAVFAAINKWLDGKIGKIRGDLDEAARLRNEAEELLRQAQLRYDSATKEADDLMAGATREAEAMQARIEAETKKMIERREQQVTDRITQAEKQALADIQKQTAQLALQMAQEQLKNLSADQREKLTQAAISDISKVA